MNKTTFVGIQTTRAGVFKDREEGIEMSVTLNTNGKGLWSNTARSVKVIGITTYYCGLNYGELRVYFDTNTWDTTKHGLIYTDPLFLSELKKYFKSIGIEGKYDYSEQGMQGDNYVSFDANGAFAKSLDKYIKEN